MPFPAIPAIAAGASQIGASILVGGLVDSIMRKILGGGAGQLAPDEIPEDMISSGPAPAPGKMTYSPAAMAGESAKQEVMDYVDDIADDITDDMLQPKRGRGSSAMAALMKPLRAMKNNPKKTGAAAIATMILGPMLIDAVRGGGEESGGGDISQFVERPGEGGEQTSKDLRNAIMMMQLAKLMQKADDTRGEMMNIPEGMVLP